MRMKSLAAVLVCLCMLMGCGKKEQAKSTPNASANKLFVEAVQLIGSAEEQAGKAAIKDYEQALGKLGKIIHDYSESDLAVKLISDETLFTGKSLKGIKERVAELKAAESKEAVPQSERAQLEKVEPGNTEVERGTPLAVLARFTGKSPRSVTLVISPKDGPTRRIEMSKNLSDPIFGTTLPNVEESFTYHVEYDQQKSIIFNVSVSESQ